MVRFLLRSDAFDFPFSLFENTLFRFIEDFGYQLGEVYFIYVSREALFQMNKKYLKHESDTDVITFDYTEGDMLSAEIYIGQSQVQDNAKECAETFLNEMTRVMIHGILHCLGYEDKTEAGICHMRQKESDFIAYFYGLLNTPI